MIMLVHSSSSHSSQIGRDDKNAIAGYIKALLKPAYQSGVVDRELFRMLAQQTTHGYVDESLEYFEV